MSAPIPAGYVRGPTGCLVLEVEAPAHSAAVAARQARHALGEKPRDVAAQLAAAHELTAKAVAKAEELAARLAKLEAPKK